MVDGRHFAGNTTQYLVSYLREKAPEGSLAAVLELAGETRSADQLVEYTTWSSYGQFRRLLEATAVVLGGPEHLEGVGAYALQSILSLPPLVEMFRSLGSPGAAYAALSQAMVSASPLVSVEHEASSPTEAIVRQRFAEGFEPFPEHCAWTRGLESIVPQLYGFAPAVIVERACQCDGAAACEVHIRWDETENDGTRAARAEFRADLYASRLAALQETVGDIVSGDGLDSVLPRIVASAAQAVQAPGYVLVIDGIDGRERRVYSEGLDTSDTERIVADLVDPDRTPTDTILVAEVVSTRCTYGRLAAIRDTGGFVDHEVLVLDTYAGLAAAALDSAASVDEARRQAATAQALLELSSALANITTPDEIAERIAHAVPAVVDCDRVAVVLAGTDGTTGRIVATRGYTTDVDAELRGHPIPLPADTSVSPDFVWYDRDTDQPDVRAVMTATGSVLLARVRIVSGGETLGWIAVDVTDRPERLRDDGRLADRLRGLAGQAASALRNGRLLDEIRHQALHDGLTGLPNRVLIMDRAEHMLARARRHNGAVAALFIDLDHFKDVNDSMGHAGGDLFLKSVAARLRGIVRDADSVGRLGGDEFVVLLEEDSLSAGPEIVAERILEVLNQPYYLDEAGIVPLAVGASIGIAVGARATADELLRDADLALYQAKDAGRGTWVVFESEMYTSVQDRLSMAMELHVALEADQLFLEYQPTFDLRTGKVNGLEALARWSHPTRGVVPPNDFIPIAEETGLILKIGRWVLHQACQRAADWRRQGHDIGVAVNVSPKQLDGDDLVADVCAALEASGLPAGALTLEITETTLMRDPDATARRLSQLKAVGVLIAIDDFGTGYSSLGHLRRFPIDAMKIDRSFISGIAVSPECGALVNTMVQLGKALDIETLAEGIEDASQLHHLQREDCDSGQGFMFARPLGADAVQQFLERSREAKTLKTAALPQFQS